MHPQKKTLVLISSLCSFQVVTTTTATDLPSTTGPPVPSTATYAARPLPPGKNCDLEAMLTGMFKAMNR